MTGENKIYIGSYSRDVHFGDGSIFHGKGKGIYRFAFDALSGSLEEEAVIDTDNPSYITLNRQNTMLYAVNELQAYAGEKTGTVSCFQNTPEGFVFVNRKVTRGLDPCHVILSPNEKYLFISNYSSGSVCIYSLKEDGSIGDLVRHIQDEGRGQHPVRQEGPHCHSTAFSPDGKYAYIMDLGLDLIQCFELTGEKDVVVPAKQPCYRCEAGDGPRCLIFDRSGRYAYVVNELSNSITVLQYDSQSGELHYLDKVSSLEKKDAETINTFADIHISPDNRFLYGSNRGDDSIVIFEIDALTGRLQHPRWIFCGGKTPRNFAISENGKYLLCANQDSDNLVVYAVDLFDGTLTQIQDLYVGSPVCVQTGNI